MSLSSAATTVSAADRYIVRFEEPALGALNSSLPAAADVAIPQNRFANGRTRLDVHSAQANAYIGYLQGRQDRHLADIANAIGHAPVALHAMRHAVNAVVLELSPQDAQRLVHVAGVAALEPERQLSLQTDVASGFVGAASIWWGTRAGQDSIFAAPFATPDGYRGDGVIVGEIDTGYNSLSPSFAASDGSGYAITNPFGHGHFIGQCNVPGISRAGCNDKVIGVYDEVGLTSGTTNPVYTVEDGMGHGSHTASTAAGNLRSATLAGYAAPITISGIAPHANLIIYRACAPYSSCSLAAIVASIDQAIADGVDALNYSISGGTNPWGDSISLAFLAAADAGIFVSTAGGNTSSTTSQVPGTVIHYEPWVATAASANHTGGALINSTPVTRVPAHADELASTSLLGPTPFDVIKPDLQAPGVSVLAAVSNDGSANGANLVGLRDGTSMATAHITGSGALLLGLHPDWTPFEVKSALMMTARESGLTKADGVTPSDYFDRGSGRIEDFEAGAAGLVLDETAQNFANANPAKGGDPGALNLASMQAASCKLACSFSRYFRSTQNHTVTWTLSVANGPNPGFSSVTLSPAKLTVAALAYSAPVTFHADTSGVATDGKFHFAEVVLTPDDNRLQPLHLPLAVAAP